MLNDDAVVSTASEAVCLRSVTYDTHVDYFRFGNFEFRPKTGELKHLKAEIGVRSSRLQPQPAKLLELLLDKRGELLTREEIRLIIWPESYVEFDQGLNFCVSQIRAALGDSAGDPTYIETLPRRGYRMIAAVERVGTLGTNDSRHSEVEIGSPSSRRPLPLGLAVIAGALLLAILWLRPGAGKGPVDLDPIRLAIMPFELSAIDDLSRQSLARISEWLVAEMSTEWDRPVAVLGPRSTAAYSQFPFPLLSRLGSELEVDFVLNARPLEKDGSINLIVELIQIDGGDHVWVKYFAEIEPWSEVARTIRDGIAEVLELQN